MKKVILGILFCCVMLAGLMTTAAFAEEMPICPNCGTNELVEREPGFGYDFFSDPDVGHYPHYICKFSGKHNTGGPKGFDGPVLPHQFVDGVCKDCEYKCRHNNTVTIGDGVYWLTCSKCNYVEEKPFPVFDLKAPDKVCRTQDCVITFTVPEGSTEPGYNWDFSKKGDGAELTPVNGVCTATVKADWYVDGENTFKVQVGAYVDGQYFYQSKTITIVDEHTGGTATCKGKAVCEVCGESYGELDGHNHVGGTVLVGEKSATCTENGNTGDTCCSGCNAVLAAGKVIFAVGHKGGTATCTEQAVCEVCGEKYGSTDPDNHSCEWKSENGEYWKHCTRCGLDSDKKAIPEIEINGADKVCRTQGYKFSFTLPEGIVNVNAMYGFTYMGDDVSLTVENGVYSGVVKAESYDENENSFVLTVNAQTADGFTFSAEQTVTILNEHTGGTATCAEQAVCEVCGEKYGEPDAGNHTELTHVAEKAATKTAEGNIEYWYCEGCGKYFADRGGTEEITKEDTVTAKLTEEETEETTETTPPSPATGDAGNLALWIALLSAGCGVAAATAIVSKKRTYNR